MKKMIAALAVLLCACGTEAYSDVLPQDTYNALETYYDGALEALDEKQICGLLNIEEETVLRAAGAYVSDAPEQFFYIVECKDEEAALDAQEAMNHYLDLMKDSAQLYSPEQLELVSKGYTAVKGSTAILIICPDADGVKLKINELYGK